MRRRSLQAVFGEVLRAHREKVRLSQEELADHAGLHRTYVSLLERGQRNPSLAVMWALAGALRVSPAALLKEVEVLRDLRSTAGSATDVART